MSYYIIIRGPLGIGKTTIATKLTQLVQGYYISLDAVLTKHGLDIPPPDAPSIPVSHFLQAQKLILPEVLNSLQQDKIVIFDGNFYYKEQLEDLVHQLSAYKGFIFTLQAPLSVCIARDSKRKLVYGEGAATALHNLDAKFVTGIIIPTENKTVAQTVATIRAYLP